MFSHWVLTWQGHDDPDSKVPRVPGPIDEKRVRYAVWQLERCPTSGKLHWQGYVELRRNSRMPGAQKAVGLPKGTHFEARKGTREQAREYCMKAESRAVDIPDHGPFEWGEWISGQGSRSDLHQATECASLKEVKEMHPTVYVKYHRGLEKLFIEKPTFNTKPEVWILWGEGTGTGKTRSVTSLGADGLVSYYKKDPGTAWWDGYEGEDLVHIDEVGKGAHEWLTANVFKQLFDYGPNYVSAKGAQRVPFMSKYVILTSNVDPKQWYPDQKWEYIERRVHKIIYCGAEDNQYAERLGDLRTKLAREAAPVVRQPDDDQVDVSAFLAGCSKRLQDLFKLASPDQVSSGSIAPPIPPGGGGGKPTE